MFTPHNRISLVLAAIIFSVIMTLDVMPEASTENPHGERSLSFQYRVLLPELPARARTVEIILPEPLTNVYQQVTKVDVDANLPYRQVSDSEYGNKLLVFQRTDSLPRSVSIQVDYAVHRREDRSLTEHVVPVNRQDRLLKRFLLPDSLVPIDGPIAGEARRVASDSMSDIEIARALYQHLFETMDYDKSGTGWGHGDALYACDVRKGNCTDIHSAFIGMARALGIPARFVMGFPLLASNDTAAIPGYHCWAQFYSDRAGWVSVDISEAIKHPELKDYLFGHLDHNRIAFTVGRDIPVATTGGTRRLNYLIYPQVYVDGKPFMGFQKSFRVLPSD